MIDINLDETQLHYDYHYTGSLVLFVLQVERAFQKQGNVNLNKKSLLMSKNKANPRWYKNIGLGFKTPREVKLLNSSNDK